MEDRVLELEALQKALQEGTGLLTSTVVEHKVQFEYFEKVQNIFANCVSAEAYDKLQANIVKARERLTKILTSKDIKATVCTNTSYLCFYCLLSNVITI